MTKDPVKVRAARARWDAVSDRAAATLPARTARLRKLDESILAGIDPATLTPEERAERVREGRSAHYRGVVAQRLLRAHGQTS